MPACLSVTGIINVDTTDIGGTKHMLEIERSAFNIAFGKRVRCLRKALGMKQQTLAEMIGAQSHSTISEIENGELMPPIDKLRALALALQTSVSALLGEEPPTTTIDPDAYAFQQSARSALEAIRKNVETLAEVLKSAAHGRQPVP